MRMGYLSLRRGVRRGLRVGLFLVVCLLPARGVAQTHYVPHVHVGMHGGMSLSKVSFYPEVPQQFLKGMLMGLSFRYAEERHVGLLAELNIEQRGWKEDFKEANALFEYQRRLTYIELPVMTHIFFGSRVVKCFFNLGPELGYMIGDNISANFDYTNPRELEGFPLKRRATEEMSMKISRRFDYGITAGVGMEFVIRRRHSIMVEGRYYYGLGSIYPTSKKDVFSASRGSSIQVTLGYMFRIK